MHSAWNAIFIPWRAGGLRETGGSEQHNESANIFWLALEELPAKTLCVWLVVHAVSEFLGIDDGNMHKYSLHSSEEGPP